MSILATFLEYLSSSQQLTSSWTFIFRIQTDGGQPTMSQVLFFSTWTFNDHEFYIRVQRCVNSFDNWFQHHVKLIYKSVGPVTINHLSL